MKAATSCPGCGATITANDRFCGECGADLTIAKPPAPAGGVQQTMLGMTSPANAPGRAPEKVQQKTMLGVASPLGSGAPAQAAVEAAPGRRSSPPRANQTLLGRPPVSFERSPAGDAPVPGKPLAGADDGQKHTVFGVPAAESAPAAQGAAPPPSGHKPALAAPSPTNRTMLGVPVVNPASLSAKGAPPAQSHQTMLGTDAPALAPAEGAGRARTSREPPARSFTPAPDRVSSSVSDTLGSLVAPRRSAGLGLALLALAVLLASVVLAWLLLRAPEIGARVVATESGDSLEIEVPGSPEGTKVRFGGEERPLAAGRALFALRPDSLALGSNELAVDVVAPSGDVQSGKVELQVEYRVRADLAPLAHNPPGVDVLVDALPGSKVSLDGAPFALDARGHGVKRYPISPQSSSAFSLRARYRIELPSGGRRVDGEVALSLPVTSAQIDRPGPDAITDQPVVEIAGAVEPSAEVLIDGQVLPVNEGRFLHNARLSEPGEYDLRVIARAPGKAPRVIEIHVRRVADMTMAAASFKYDPAITYARITQNPVIYRGQNVSFDGRVYNVEVQGGRSVLQMLVLACPGSSRCPLWVEYPQATDATVDTWVRVLGTVTGEQQFRSKQGAVQTVPSVRAQYVLKLAR